MEQKYCLLYTHDRSDADREPIQFHSVAEYRKYLHRNGLLKVHASAIIITGSIGEPKELIARLEDTGNTVYPVNSIREFIEGHHADSIPVAAVINMAHGRMGDNMVNYLKTRNIPLFAPLNVNRLVKEWEADKRFPLAKRGYAGDRRGASVVCPLRSLRGERRFTIRGSDT